MHRYFDHNATTPVVPEIIEAMVPYLGTEYGNASSIHRFGQRAKAAVERGRAQLAALIHCEPAELVMTSGGTEADNMAVLGAVGAARAGGRSKLHVITTTIEHPAILRTCQAIEKEGVAVTYLPVDGQGFLDPGDVRRAVRPETVLITVMHGNNEIGSVEPIEAIAAIGRETGVLVHTDAVQTTGKIPVDFREMGVDLLSLSAHKFYGPKGVGALSIRKGVTLRPILFGGHDDRDPRPGTTNVAGVVGIGAAAQLAAERLESEAARLGTLRDRLEREVLTRIEDAGVNGTRVGMRDGQYLRVPNTTNLYFDYIEAESLVIALDLNGLACSTGAACAAGAIEPSHVLTAIGVPAERARASIRLSLGRANGDADIDTLVAGLEKAVERLRSLSPRTPAGKTGVRC
jgi:cysteine desulfurase